MIRRLNAAKIGDQITVFIEDYSEWCVATIIELNETQIKLKLIHYESDEMWIDKTYEKIIVSKSVIGYSNLIPIAKNSIPPYPVFYNNQIIVSIGIHDGDDEGAIYSYNIDRNTYDKIADYPTGFEPDETGLAVDKTKHELYIFSGASKTFAIYNLVTKKWDINDKPQVTEIRYPKSFYIPSPVDQLYFIGDSEDNLCAVKYSKHTETFSSITSKFPYPKLGNPEIIYDENRKRIMLFGGYIDSDEIEEDEERKDDIWFYDIYGDDSWNEYSLKLPNKNGPIRAIYAFDSIVFILYFTENKLSERDIWCLELNTNQWFKSGWTIPLELCSGDMVKTDDNYIHLLSYSYPLLHVRMNLYDMIPPQLFDFYAKYYSNIIYGYVRMQFEEKYGYHMTNDLKHLISKYYDAFS